LLPGVLTLEKLHSVIQAAMGWENRHLHVFDIDGKSYGPPDIEVEEEERDLDEDGVRIHLLLDEGDHFTYEYDFGDTWIHDIEVETVSDVAMLMSQAVCLDGARACPPEDCGGPWGFAEFVKVMVDPDHIQHETMVEWFGGPFDAEVFLLGDANARIQRIR
jgi:Plasmid pRiA4b ORF-3-like protein